MDHPSRAGGTPKLTLHSGDAALNKSLTIVLPVHNAETRLRKNVAELLELASELTAKFGVLIIDDGSTDATFEVAAELATHYPQVSVRRNRQCRGLGASLDYARRRVRTDAVIVHDGVTPINSQQMRGLWQNWLDRRSGHTGRWDGKTGLPQDAPPLENLPSIHRDMERAHQRLAGFQLLAALADDRELESATSPAESYTTSRQVRAAGVGRIPSVPKPKFLSAVAEFAFGE
jgi:hypothetical protein